MSKEYDPTDERSIGGRIATARRNGNQEALEAALRDKHRLYMKRAQERADAILASIKNGEFE